MRIRLLALALWGSLAAAGGDEPGLTAVLVDGTAWPGHAAEIVDGNVVVYLRENGGMSARRAPLAGVQEVRFAPVAGQAEGVEALERGDASQAVKLLRGAVALRLPLAARLASDDGGVCSAFAEALLRSGEAGEAAAVAGRLVRFGRADERASGVLVEALLRIGHPDALRVARAWCEQRDPADGAALGWWVVAELELRAGNPREAVWVALQPVVFARGARAARDARDLALCHAVAVEACRRLGWADEARGIRTQLDERRLGWPADAYPEALGWVDGLAPEGPAPEVAAAASPAAPAVDVPVLPGRLLLRPRAATVSRDP